MARSRVRASIGLDIGTSGARAVEVSTSGSGYTIERLASVDLSPGVVSNGTVKEPGEVATALRRLWRQGRFSSRQVRFGVTNSVIMTRRVDLPWMAEEDFRKALRYQVGDVLPVDLSTVEVDHHPLRELSTADEHGTVMESLRVLVVAADSSLVGDIAAAVRKGRLEPVAADDNAFAVLRAACGGTMGPSVGAGPDAVVDIGGDQLTVVIHSGGVPEFVRTVASVGGNAVTAELSETLGLSLEEAEELKRTAGLNGPPAVLAPLPESSVFGGLATAASPLINPRVAAALEIINPWASTLIGEIRNSLEYFRAAEGGRAVRSLVVTGGTARLDGLVDRMRTQLRLPISEVEPLLGLPASKRVLADPPTDSRYAVAAGLAMAGDS